MIILFFGRVAKHERKHATRRISAVQRGTFLKVRNGQASALMTRSTNNAVVVAAAAGRACVHRFRWHLNDNMKLAPLQKFQKRAKAIMRHVKDTQLLSSRGIRKKKIKWIATSVIF